MSFLVEWCYLAKFQGFRLAFSKVPCALLCFQTGILPLNSQIHTKQHLVSSKFLLLRKGQMNTSLLSPKVNIQLLSRVVREQKFEGQNSTQRQTKEKVRVSAVNSQGDALTHLCAASYEKFLPLVFQYEVEITS